MRRVGAWVIAGLLTVSAPLAAASWTFIDAQIAANAGKSGVYVLERGEEALLARAWLADHAEKSIAVQYFIWSTDNVGILASEALLRAAERGVQVRVIVDDLLVDAPDASLLALARHPNIEIRIYNPKHSVGTSIQRRVLNVVTDFRGVNQRMHDKTFIVDGKIAITGGRNMADEYFDYDQEYNFRDRDALVLGPAVADMAVSFERFWQSELSVEVEELYDGIGFLQKRADVDDGAVRRVYAELHTYAQSPENFAPEVRAALAAMPEVFPRLAKQVTWGKMEFISDRPGKNDNRFGLGGGGLTSEALARMVEGARTRIVVQSPYLVLSNEAKALLQKALDRNVRIRISTNSLASTDNLAAFGGYRRQRQELLKMGIEIFEYKPDPEIQRRLMTRTVRANARAPIFAIHAKTMVVDSATVYIGTFNLDPRSENLNTEVGIIIHDERLARAVEGSIETDMLPTNSWNAADKPDRHASIIKRTRARFWQLMPITPLL